MRDVNKTVKDKFNEEKKKLASGQKQLTRGEIKKAAKAGKRLFADVASTCFDELSWKAYEDGDGTGR